MKRKLITAIVILLVTFPLIWFGGFATAALALAVGVVGMIEIVKTRKEKKWHPLVNVMIILGTVVGLLWSFIMAYIDGDASFGTMPSPYEVRINILMMLLYLIVLLILEVTTKEFMMKDVFYIFTMTVFIVISCQAMIYIRQSFKMTGLFYIFLVTWGTDACAQLSGKFLGGKIFKQKEFAPVISPKKTWEGTLGGCVLGSILGFAFYMIFPFATESAPHLNWVFAIVASIILSIGAVFGDLIFSAIKRQVHIKDFGDILPEHGGILDRFDSILFNLLLFISYCAILNSGLFV